MDIGHTRILRHVCTNAHYKKQDPIDQVKLHPHIMIIMTTFIIYVTWVHYHVIKSHSQYLWSGLKPLLQVTLLTQDQIQVSKEMSVRSADRVDVNRMTQRFSADMPFNMCLHTSAVC